MTKHLSTHSTLTGADFIQAASFYSGASPEPQRIVPDIGQTYAWVGQTGDLGASYNWLNTGNPSLHGEPDAGDTATLQFGQNLYGTLTIGGLSVVNGATTPISFGSASNTTTITATTLNLSGPVQFEENTDLTSSNLTIQGSTIVDSAGISVQGSLQIAASATPSSLLLTDYAFLNIDNSDAQIGFGTYGSATLTAADGAFLEANGGSIALGDTSGDLANDSGSGTLIITDPDTEAFLEEGIQVGNYGQGAILVENGAYATIGGSSGVSVGSTDTGVVGAITVTGAGSVLSIDGSLSVGLGGALAADAGGVMQMEVDADVQGSLLVNGPGSEFSARELTLDYGSVVSILSGGTVNAIDILINGTAAPIQVEGGTLTAHTTIVDETNTSVIEGFGRINARNLFDFASIAAQAGTLVVNADAFNINGISATAGSVLDLRQGGDFDNVSGAGTLLLEGTSGDYEFDTGTLSIGTMLLNSGTTAYLLSNIVSSTITDNGTLTVYSDSFVNIKGKLSGAGSIELQSGSALELAAAGTLSETISGAGTLQLAAATTLGKMAPIVAELDVLKSGSLSGAGTLTAVIEDAGSIAAAGGTLALAGGFTAPVTGTLSAGTGAVLDITSAGTLAGAIVGAGTLRLDAVMVFAPHAALSVGSVIDNATIRMAAGENLTNAAGHGFAINAASATTLALGGSATNTFTNAGSFAAAGAGAVSIGATFNNTGTAALGAASLTFAGVIANTGTITATGAVLFDRAVSGTGTLDIGATGTLSLLAGAASGQQADFLATTGALDLTAPTSMLGTIAGFAGSDMIDLVKTPETAFSYAAGILTVKSGSTTEATLHFAGTYTAASFAITPDGHGGSLISFV